MAHQKLQQLSRSHHAHHPGAGHSLSSAFGPAGSVAAAAAAAAAAAQLNSSSLHRFSVDALAGTGNCSDSKDEQLLNVTSDDDDNSIASWDEDIGIDDDDEDEEIDVGPMSPTAVSTTSESSRASPIHKRRK